jgi:ABC-type phosphate/phosphonate transport system substrate-binding protein
VVGIASDDFKKVLKQTTGLSGELTTKLGPFEIADKLDKRQLDFGIFHAHEFAWVQKKHADLEPLLVAINKKHGERAYVIVHKNSPAKSIGDLKGKKLDTPIGTNELCRAFVARLTRDSAKLEPAKFFGAIEKSSGAAKALDQVAFEKVDAAVIDVFALEFYKEVKGPTFKNYLRVLAESEDFPPSVIVRRKDAPDEKTLQQFRDGLLKAHQVEDGREMMKEWNLDAFEAVPKDYNQRLAAITKLYPTP